MLVILSLLLSFVNGAHHTDPACYPTGVCVGSSFSGFESSTMYTRMDDTVTMWTWADNPECMGNATFEQDMSADDTTFDDWPAPTDDCDEYVKLRLYVTSSDDCSGYEDADFLELLTGTGCTGMESVSCTDSSFTSSLYTEFSTTTTAPDMGFNPQCMDTYACGSFTWNAGCNSFEGDTADCYTTETPTTPTPDTTYYYVDITCMGDDGGDDGTDGGDMTPSTEPGDDHSSQITTIIAFITIAITMLFA